jgi:hypothetical protein
MSVYFLKLRKAHPASPAFPLCAGFHEMISCLNFSSFSEYGLSEGWLGIRALLLPVARLSGLGDGNLFAARTAEFMSRNDSSTLV